MKTFATEQEKFWAGEFGSEYIGRNQSATLKASNVAFFSKILNRTQNVRSVIEFGANIGLNLLAIRELIPGIAVSGVEINETAAAALRQIPGAKVYAESLLDFNPDEPRDLALIKGVLIHLNPEKLPTVYDLLYRSTNRYLCIAEYYNPAPVEMNYRGHQEKLFKRDFAGELLDRFPDLQLLDYGFAYHRDPQFPQDDITWFLFEKREATKGDRPL
jgi:pseudaminic acid biosynthesis-associated methylase